MNQTILQIMPKIIIPTPLRKFTGNQASIETEGRTVAEAFDRLTGQYPELKRHLYDESNRIRSFVRIYVGDDDINGLQKEDTPLDASSVVSIIPAIAGGLSD